jgi:hypothetical protein
MYISQRREWAKRVMADLRKKIEPSDRVIFFAGEKYREFLEP